MSLSSTALSAIQQAGAAVFTADAELKNAVKDYAERVNTAMVANPYGLGNDALFENWKVVARLSQTVAGIEEELKKVYRVAADLIADDGPTVTDIPALAAPARPTEPSVKSQDAMAPTDVVAKPKKKTKKIAAAKNRAPKAAPIAVKPVAAAARQEALGGNPAKLLQYFERLLDASKFTGINQSIAGQKTGIPLGSMTAAIKKLIESGRLIAGPSGSFKLATTPR